MMKTISSIVFFLLLSTLPSYANLSEGLVGWWKMDEGTGVTTADSSGHGNTGTFTGTPTWTNGCIKNKCLEFNGVDQFISTPSNDLPSGSSPRATSLWIKISQYANFNIAYGYGDVGDGNVFGYYLNSDILNFWGNNNDINTGYSITLNVWHNIVTNFDGTNISMYVDGAQVLAPTPPPTPLTTGTNGMLIGKSYNDDYYPGLVDDVRVYNRTLSTQEISDLYKSGIRIRNAVIRNAHLDK